MISGTPSFDLEFDLEGKMKVKCHGYVSCSGRLSIVLDNFGMPAYVILEKNSNIASFDFKFDLKYDLEKTKMKVIHVFSILNLTIGRRVN